MSGVTGAYAAFRARPAPGPSSSKPIGALITVANFIVSPLRAGNRLSAGLLRRRRSKPDRYGPVDGNAPTAYHLTSRLSEGVPNDVLNRDGRSDLIVAGMGYTGIMYDNAICKVGCGVLTSASAIAAASSSTAST